MAQERFQEGSHLYKSDWKERLSEGVWIDGVLLPDAFYDFYGFKNESYPLGVKIEVVRNPNHPCMRLIDRKKVALENRGQQSVESSVDG